MPPADGGRHDRRHRRAQTERTAVSYARQLRRRSHEDGAARHHHRAQARGRGLPGQPLRLRQCRRAKAAASKFGAQIVALIPHNAKGDDIDMVVDKIAAANPQTTLLFTSPTSVADMLMRYQAKHGPVPLPQPWILSVTTPKTVFEKAGPLAHGVAVTQVMPGPNARTQPLVRAFREANDKFGDHGNQTYEAVEGFLTARVIVDGLRACGSNPTRDGFIQALEGFGTRDFGGVRVHYDRNNHAGLDYVDVTMIGSNGHLVG
nr:ABC transporter substrate-binding protein [Ralstonia sp. TCR112]